MYQHNFCGTCIHKDVCCNYKEYIPSCFLKKKQVGNCVLTSMKDFMRVPDIESGKLVWVRASDYFDQGA
jgi:hypothetical protein